MEPKRLFAAGLAFCLCLTLISLSWDFYGEGNSARAGRWLRQDCRLA